eukprot:scaffold77315_cov72-Phaeocystis_antarctica.AAC.2
MDEKSCALRYDAWHTSAPPQRPRHVRGAALLELMFARPPFALISSPVAPSSSTRVGIPSTSYRFESASLRLSPGGMASHGIVAKYSWNCLMSLSLETKTTSNSCRGKCRGKRRTKRGGGAGTGVLREGAERRAEGPAQSGAGTRCRGACAYRWGEGLARRAPVRREVEADDLALMCLATQCGELDRLTVARHELVTHRLPDRRRPPWEAVAPDIRHHNAPAVLGDQLARLAVEDDQRWDARDLILLRQRRLELALGVRLGEPRLLSIVRLEGPLVVITRDEDDLDALAHRHEALVRLGQLWREVSAGRTPVRGEVDGHRLLALERLRGGDDAVLGLELLPEQLHERHMRARVGLSCGRSGAGGATGFRPAAGDTAASSSSRCVLSGTAPPPCDARLLCGAVRSAVCGALLERAGAGASTVSHASRGRWVVELRVAHARQANGGSEQQAPCALLRRCLGLELAPMPACSVVPGWQPDEAWRWYSL